MSSYIPHPASAPSQPFAQTNPFEFAREHTIRDDWALRLDPETDTPDRLRAGAFAIMSEGFGIKDPTGRVFSGAQQNALDPKEYFAKARACWDAGSLAPVQSEGWNAYHDAAEKGDRATMRRLARENIRGEDAGNDVAAAWDPAMSRIGLKDDLDMERELLSVRDVLTPEEIAIIEESGRARAEKTAQTEFASDTFDEDFYENASAFDFMFARNKDLRDEETKARHAEANSRLAEVYRRHANDIRDEQRLPAYEKQLADENLWATVQGLRGAVSDDAWRVVEMAQQSAGSPTQKRVLDAFEKLTTTEQRSIAGVLHALHYGRDTTLVGDAFRSFWDTAAQTVGGSARAIADVFRRGVMDGKEYRDMVERRALLEQANSGRMKEWGYLGQSVVGAFSTIPYMAVAAIPYAGTAAIMASASDQFQTEAALNGVDVGSREFMLTNWAFSGAYAAVEKLQIVPFKPLKNVSRRQMYCEMFHSLRSALFVAGVVAGTTVSESVEEGIQGGIERVVEGWGLGHDQAKEFAAGFASDFVGSLGTMAIIGAVGAGVQHHRYRSGAFSPEEAISATARVADLESRIKGHPEDAAVPLGEFSREFGMLGRDWVNAGTEGTTRVRALMRWGFSPEQATRLHGMFSEIWRGVSGDEEARSEFVGGNRVRSAAELLADTLGVQVEDGENGEKSVSFRIGRGRVKLRFNPADHIETAVDVNDRTQAADVVEILNRNEEATTGTRGTMTVDEWLALPEEVRREQTKGMTVQGGFKIDAPDGTSVGEDALRVLSGRVIETDVALPQTVFHESMHAVLRLLREEAADDPEARALQEELAKVYAPQAGIDEAVNEEALADGYQTYLTSLTTAVEDTGVFARLKRWIARLLGRATVARDSLRAAQSAQGRLFNLALTGDITPAMRKEEAKQEEPRPSPTPAPAPSAPRYSVTPHGVQKQAGVAYPDASSEIVRFSIGARRREEYRDLLSRKRPDLDAESVLAELDKLGDPKKEKIALHWIVRGTIRLPEDAYKVEDAIEVAAKAKVDPFAYKSPDELLLANKQFNPTARPIDPATVPELSDPRDEGDGIVSYEVQDDQQGQAAMRRIIDTHWGEDANPWCLLARDKHTEDWTNLYRSWFGTAYPNELQTADNFKKFADEFERRTGSKARSVLSDEERMQDAWYYWNHYNALPKRVAFKDGKLLAFMATDVYDSSRDMFGDEILNRFSPEEADRLRREYEEWHASDEGQEEGADFYEWLDHEHPDVIDQANEAEQWWDRKDESHPDLDWARDDSRYQIAAASSAADLAEARRQYDEVVARYTNQDGTRKPGWMKAPNGADTHLTERQWVQVRTPAFKAWFGDWENDPANASRVVDENGEPRVMWRGAPFDPLSQEPGKGVIAAERYFTPNEAYARRYEKGAGATRAYFLNVRRPFDVRDARDAARLMELRGGNDFHVGKTGALDWAEAPSAEEIEELWPGEYDGLVLDEGGDPTASGGVAYRGESVIPFAGGAQVKSATDNVGTFSGERGDVRYSISGIYTGTAADYDKPSLHYVGTGEGSQVYGWGLYGSNVRGVAEGYAKQSETNPEILDQQNRSAFDPTGDDVADEARKALASMYIAGAESVDKAVGMALARLREKGEAKSADWLKEHSSEFHVGRRRNANVYEQTFFTNRAPGDESHLLKWYEEVPRDTFDRIVSALKEEGRWGERDGGRDILGRPETIYGTLYGAMRHSGGEWTGGDVYELVRAQLGADENHGAREASEWLAAHGIDGVKYPVDSFGGKGVKDGDKVGWNYVSFRDDNIRVDHKWVDGEQRYSITPAEDAAYMDAVQSGDMETAQRMVREAAAKAMPNTKVVDEDGLPKVVYHGTPLGGFTEFDTDGTRKVGITGAWFSDDSTYSQDFARKQRFNGRIPNGAGIYGVFLNLQNPDVLYAEGSDYSNVLDGYKVDYFLFLSEEVAKEFAERHGLEMEETTVSYDELVHYIREKRDWETNPHSSKKSEALFRTNEKVWKSWEQTFDYFRALEKDFEQVGIPKDADGTMVFGMTDGVEATNQYVAFRPNQIKSADPVTYNDAGNVIPLSQRFNPASEDIRYQISGAVGAEALGIRGLADAEAMERSGADRTAIWRETGWWRGRDGEWRVEIPDFELSENLNGSKEDLAEERKLSEREFNLMLAIRDANKDFEDFHFRRVAERLNVPEADRASFDAETEKKEKAKRRGIERMIAERERASRDLEALRSKKIVRALSEGRTVRLSDVIKPDSALANAYPSIGEIRVYANAGLPYGVAGQWNGNSIDLSPELLRGDPEKFRSVLAHEVQHVVQTIEGFARGGDETTFRENVLDEERIKSKMFSPELSESEYADLQRQLSAIREGRGGQVFADGRFFNTPFDAYRHLAGEAEARLVQKRLNMTPEERAARPPWLDYDVEEERMLVRYQIQPKTAPHGVQKQSAVEYPDAGAEIARFSIGARRREEYRSLLANRRPDLDAEKVLAELDKLGDPKKEKVALHWVVRGSLLLPQDSYKIDDALDVAAKAKVDPFAYKSPDELLLANKQFKPSARPIDPATVPELSDPRDEGDGIVSYLVQDDREGQKAMRRIIDTHWGEDANPWCLLAKQGGGEFVTDEYRAWIRRDPHWTPDDWFIESNRNRYEKETGKKAFVRTGWNLDGAWNFWQHYSALPKRVAFKDGKLLAFMATDNEAEEARESALPNYVRRDYTGWLRSHDFDEEYDRDEHIEQFLTEEYPDLKPRAEEEWWDRQDESHPDLDWARDDSRYQISGAVGAEELGILGTRVAEAERAAGDVARASVVWNGPAYSYKSFATAYAARDRILGIDRPDDDYRRLLETMGVRDYSVDDLKADAEKIRARGLGRNEATLQRLAGLAEQESMARTVESLMRGSLELGEDVGSSARRAYETYLARMRRTAKGRDYTDLTADLGFDLADLALAIDPEAFAPKPKPEGDATPPAGGSDAEVAALLDGKAADFGLTEEQLRERIQERMEQRTQEIRERLERIRARLDEWRAKEALRKAKLAERQEAEGKSDAPADVPDAEMFDAEQNETEAGAKRLADYESECVEEMPDFRAFLEECRRDGLDLSDAAEFVAAVRIWSEDFIARETGADPEKVLRDPVNLARYRATMMEFLHGMADAMLDPEDGAAAKTAERMMQEIPSDATVGEIDGRARTIVGFIQRNGIRQTRKQLIRELRKGIKLEAIRGKKWDEMERDAGRKVTGEREAAARYLYRILTWSDGMIAKESARLHDIVAGREDAYRSAGADDAALKDLARTDREVHRASEKLQALQMYGGLRKKSPAEIKVAARAIMSWLTEEREAHEKRWNDWHARLDALAQRAAKAASASAQDYTPEDPGRVGKLADELTATIRQRLEQLFVGGGADARAVIDEVMRLVYAGSERMRAETAAARRRTDEMLERCVQGTGRNVRQFLKDLDAPIPDELNRQLRTAEQPVRMTNGQALQLLASLEQVASYAGNIEANGRGAERVVGTDPDGNPITEPQTPHAELLRRYFADKPAMVRLLEGIREVYEERRGALSDTFRAVTGNPILAPDPLYAPVKMFRGSSEGFETQVRAWDPFGPALQPRIKNTLDFDLSASIMDVYNNRTRETCRAIAWGIPGMELRSVLCRKEVQDAIARTHGKFPLRQLVAHLTDLVSDGWADEPSGFKWLAQKLGGATTYSALSWNVVTALKQTASIPAWTALMDGGYAEVFRNIANFDRAAARELMDAPGFAARYGSTSFGRMFKDAIRDPNANPLQRFFQAGMTAVQMGDFVPGILVGTGVYKAKKLALMRQGLEERQAREEAARIAWGLIEECQQSSRLENSPAFLRRGGFLARQAAKFASSPLLQVSHEVHTLRMWAAEAKAEARRNGGGVRMMSDSEDVARWRRRFVNQLICNHVLMPVAFYGIATMFNIALGSEPPDEEEVLGDLAMQTIVGPFGRIFLLGMIFDKGGEAVARAMGGKPNVYDSTGLAAQQYIQKIVGQLGRIGGDVADADWESVRDDLLKMLGQVSAPARYAVKIGQNAAGYDPAEAMRERKAEIRRERGE